MIGRCKNCKASCVSHNPPGDLCFVCFSSAGFEPMPAAEASDAAKSWDGLLGQSDEDLMQFCKDLAAEAFGEEASP